MFSDGKSSAELDTICAEQLVSSRESYVKDEYDEDGILIYSPPPLDEVWLSEPERRTRRKALEEQQDRASRRRVVESREVKKRLQRSKEPTPGHVESDVDNDDEDSLSGEPHLKSGGEAVEERDMWSDH